MKFYVHLLIILAMNFAIGQVGNTVEKGATLQTGNAGTPFLRASTNSRGKVVGSEYLDEEWKQATVIDRNTKKKVSLLARFNAYTREVEILRESDMIALLPVEGVSATLNGKTFVPVTTQGATKPIFAEQLLKGKMSLFKVYNVRVLKAATDATLLNADDSDKINIVDKLYYRIDGNTVTKLPTKKKSFENLIDADTKTFIKKEKLSLKKEADVIRIFEYFNEK